MTPRRGSGQAPRPSSGQAPRPSSGQGPRRSSEQASRPSSRQAPRPSSGQAPRPSSGQADPGLPFDAASGPVVAYIDGGARGNPGPAGFGVRIEDAGGELIEEIAESIGVATNNVAEYRALIAALEWARRHGHRQLHVRSDSQLLVQQMLGNYKVKHPGLLPLAARARMLAHEVGGVTFEHVRREKNAHADRLANTAMDDAAQS